MHGVPLGDVAGEECGHGAVPTGFVFCRCVRFAGRGGAERGDGVGGRCGEMAEDLGGCGSAPHGAGCPYGCREHVGVGGRGNGLRELCPEVFADVGVDLCGGAV